MVRIGTAVAVIAGTVTAGVGVQTGSAAADTAYTFNTETFNEAAFPPAGWQDQSDFGTWTANCSPAAPGPDAGCFAQASITPTSDGSPSGAGSASLLFGPSQPLPADLQNATISFYSDFTTDATTGGDRLTVGQALQNGNPGDLAPIVMPDDGGVDPSGTPVYYSEPLPNLNLPLKFMWTSYGDDSSAPTKSWGISDVVITGTLPPTTLTADPVYNTAYSPVAGTPVTITLSGSSDPSGDALEFRIASQPTLGTLSAITQVNATHATVVYTAPTAACPDPSGVPTMICPDSFTYEATDGGGNVSAPANVALDLAPGGAGSQLPTISAPGTVNYVTVAAPGGSGTTQAADLSGSLSVGPTNFPDELEVEVAAATGTVHLFNADAAPVTFLNGTSSSAQEMFFKGSPAKVAIALGEFLYYPPAGTTPSTTITIYVGDLGPTGDGIFRVQTQATVHVKGPNSLPAPVLAVPAGPLSISTGAGTLAFSPGTTTGFSLSDDGAGALDDDTVDLSVSGGVLTLPASDSSGDTAIVTVVSGSAGASLELTGTVAHLNTALGDLGFDPAGLPSSTVMLSAMALNPVDGETSSASPVSVPITVVEAPFAFGATAITTLENTASGIFLCGGGPAGDTLGFTVNTQPTHGVLTAGSATGSGCSQNSGSSIQGYTYTPDTGYLGPDSISYTVTDATTGLSSALNTISLTVAPHQKPTAYAVTASTRQDTAVDVILCGNNPETSGLLTFATASAPSFGTVTYDGVPSLNTCDHGNEAYQVTYTPNPGAFRADGTDFFSYTVSDGTISDSASVTVNVTTRTPQVVTKNLNVDENGVVGFELCSTQPAVISFSVVSGPSNGKLDGTYAPLSGGACPTGYFGQFERYVPDAMYSGPDVVYYQASGGGYTSALAAISITVTWVEVPPTATSQSVAATAHRPVAITLAGKSAQGSSITYRIVNPPAHGTLTGVAPALTYTSDVGSGQDSFTYVTNDGVADSSVATVTISIITPQLASSVCLPGGAPLGLDEYACASQLQSVPDGSGGEISLAHTAGDGRTQLRLQVMVTNRTAIADKVTLTGPTLSGGWTALYATDGQDRTADMTASGAVVTLGPAGSPTDTAYVLVSVFSPRTRPAPVATTLTITATSGNDPAISTSLPVEVADGSSSPTLALAQADGTGSVSFPDSLQLRPVLYVGGPAGGATIIPSLSGTGDNTFRMQAAVQAGSNSHVDVTYYLGSLNVTSEMVAGRLDITCYAQGGCPPMRVVLTPQAGASGYVSVLFTDTSVVDGQATLAYLFAPIATGIGPDLYGVQPLVGNGVFESTPVSQSVTVPVAKSGTASKVIEIENDANVADTFDLKAAVVLAAGDTSRLTFQLIGPDGDGTPVDITAALLAGSYRLPLDGQRGAELVINDAAGATTDLAAPRIVLTATSELETTKTDSFQVAFPGYYYRPDAVITDSTGKQIGSGVYETGVSGAHNYPAYITQTEFENISLYPTSTNITFAERGKGTGSWPSTDSVTVKAPATNANVVLSYATQKNGVSTDVTSQVTGAGLTLALQGNGGPAQTLVVTAAATTSSRAGIPTYVDVTVTSNSALPSIAGDIVEMQLYNSGSSQLRFAGLPQPEPTDITTLVNQLHLQNRNAPLPSAGYAPGVTYGAYSDPTGQKFVYASAYDTFGLQVASDMATHTSFRLEMSAPGLSDATLPDWTRDVFASPYYTGSALLTPENPLSGPDSVHPKITANGQDVTAAVEAGTFTTASLRTLETADVTVSFSPGKTGLRYTPLKFTLVDAGTGVVQDVVLVGLTSAVSCSPDGDGQHLVTITDSSGRRDSLSFRSFDRTGSAGATECLQHLSHSWITKLPVVFGSYVPATANSEAGGDNPYGFWLLPQLGAITRIDTDTLEVTSAHAKAYVDTPQLGNDGQPIRLANGQINPQTIAVDNYVGDFPNLAWNTTDGTTGLAVDAHSPIGGTPFPLIAPSKADWPGNTMGAQRYIQIDTATGEPVMIGEMRMNEPWYQGDVPFIMDVDSSYGMLLEYNAPQSVPAMTLPGDSSVSSYFAYWTTRQDGTIVQGGCAGLPPHFLELLDIPSSLSYCLFEVTTTFKPIPADPNQEAKIANISIDLKNPVAGQLGSPEFNLSQLAGSIDLDPTTGSVRQVVLDTVFGIGPPTPCQARQNSEKAAGVKVSAGQTLLDLPCPSNYFFYDAQVTFKQGGFTSANSTSGIGIKFSGTLSLLDEITLANVEADVSTSPFNFHFEDSPVDLSIPAVPLSAKLTFSGDIGALGFDIGISGSVSAWGTTLASASGILSTKGFGVCGGLAGISIGFGDDWGASPTFYPSGCTTAPYEVTSS